MIAIYHGNGVSWQGEIKGQPITAEEIDAGKLKDFSVLIMPGGRDRLYHAALRGKPNQKIRDFVEQGGLYVGICAGAYYGCGRVEFDQGFPLEVCEDRELAFFPGKAIGPAFGKGTYEYESEKGARLAKVGDHHCFFPVYYNGGCTFQGDLTCKKVKVLACYLELPGEPPAIIECSIGKGKALLTGVHLEKSGHLAQYLAPD